ncbi:unnamed protein product [Acanthoscelides obtectus]|uniref:Uncharacterized protein n=1 Tax=Acanthoscelides obtectus TaxID=200917 RepID=A0A9P0PRC6_ACAOB|nr:unnamed protein product [Acanthoscelides obtectus]CAK1663327.1 hypothetical protein AOBTE_LOCUS23613 [Acanthoscelides obtectus]
MHLSKQNRLYSSSFSFSSPSKRRKRKSPVLDKMTAGQIEEIKAIIHDFYILEKRKPTLKRKLGTSLVG